MWLLFWAILGPPWGYLERSWGYVGRSWCHLGAISNLAGAILGDLGASSKLPGAIWGNLGAICRQVMKKLVSRVDVALLLLKTLIFPCVFDVEVGFVR